MRSDLGNLEVLLVHHVIDLIVLVLHVDDDERGGVGALVARDEADDALGVGVEDPAGLPVLHEDGGLLHEEGRGDALEVVDASGEVVVQVHRGPPSLSVCTLSIGDAGGGMQHDGGPHPRAGRGPQPRYEEPPTYGRTSRRSAPAGATGWCAGRTSHRPRAPCTPGSGATAGANGSCARPTGRLPRDRAAPRRAGTAGAT